MSILMWYDCKQRYRLVDLLLQYWKVSDILDILDIYQTTQHLSLTRNSKSKMRTYTAVCPSRFPCDKHSFKTRRRGMHARHKMWKLRKQRRQKKFEVVKLVFASASPSWQSMKDTILVAWMVLTSRSIPKVQVKNREIQPKKEWALQQTSCNPCTVKVNR